MKKSGFNMRSIPKINTSPDIGLPIKVINLDFQGNITNKKAKNHNESNHIKGSKIIASPTVPFQLKGDYMIFRNNEKDKDIFPYRNKSLPNITRKSIGESPYPRSRIRLEDLKPNFAEGKTPFLIKGIPEHSIKMESNSNTNLNLLMTDDANPLNSINMALVKDKNSNFNKKVHVTEVSLSTKNSIIISHNEKVPLLSLEKLNKNNNIGFPNLKQGFASSNLSKFKKIDQYNNIIKSHRLSNLEYGDFDDSHCINPNGKIPFNRFNKGNQNQDIKNSFVSDNIELQYFMVVGSEGKPSQHLPMSVQSQVVLQYLAQHVCEYGMVQSTNMQCIAKYTSIQIHQINKVIHYCRKIKHNSSSLFREILNFSISNDLQSGIKCTPNYISTNIN